MIDVYLVNLENKRVDDILNKYQNHLKDQDIKRMEKYKTPLKQKQILFSSILKNKFIDGDITYNEYGKPLHDKIYFNISHSKDYVIMALTKKQEIGVDIEYIKDKVNDDLIDYVLSEKEKDFVNLNKTKNFYYLWTRKEAILKCTGRGIVKNLKQIDGLNENNEYILHTYFLNGYVYTIALKKQGNDYSINLKIFDENAL